MSAAPGTELVFLCERCCVSRRSLHLDQTDTFIWHRGRAGFRKLHAVDIDQPCASVRVEQARSQPLVPRIIWHDESKRIPPRAALLPRVRENSIHAKRGTHVDAFRANLDALC